MSRAVIGMGSNLGDKFGNMMQGLHSVSLLPATRVIKASKIYETDPVGYSEQPVFYNAAILIETQLSPNALLGACLGIEAAAGRIRTVKDGPRTLDLDLLLYESIKTESFELTLPHPKMMERAFVLVPLNDIFPSGRALGISFLPSFRELDKSGVRDTLFTLKNDWMAGVEDCGGEV
ncbi:MAG: 2-amino-4-hydroxy-6-hydroxymethyldihydropteridine diphosphokinase [Clostridiales bacterium]|jgi:2-amino-4-hydroxy-6-hydroxymethyldihydropteridine diphosphokinase|nr:2-amino-4-hydroxy-6-hydroxymethyldihydropteridine diphosphokinase [Clostridiales bacterium]